MERNKFAGVHKICTTINFDPSSRSAAGNGRCLGMCCDWIRCCVAQGGVNRFEEMDVEKMNNSQNDYEENLQDEVRLLQKWFGLAVANKVERKPVQESLGKRKSVEVILKQFRDCAPNSFTILGLTNVNEKNRAFGHAIAFRCFKVTLYEKSHLLYEFLDPNIGIWRCDNRDLIFEFLDDFFWTKHLLCFFLAEQTSN